MDIEYSPETVTLVASARVSWNNLKTGKDWDDWRIIGYAIDAARSDIVAALGINDPNSKKLKDHMGLWLRDTGFNEIDKGSRSHLSRCMAHIGAIDEWRSRLEPSERVRMNCPHTVWSRFKRTLEDAVDKPPRRTVKDEQIEALQALIDKDGEVIASMQKMLDLAREQDQLREQQAEELKWHLAGAASAVEELAELKAAIKLMGSDARIRLATILKLRGHHHASQSDVDAALIEAIHEDERDHPQTQH